MIFFPCLHPTKRYRNALFPVQADTSAPEDYQISIQVSTSASTDTQISRLKSTPTITVGIQINLPTSPPHLPRKSKRQHQHRKASTSPLHKANIHRFQPSHQNRRAKSFNSPTHRQNTPLLPDEEKHSRKKNSSFYLKVLPFSISLQEETGDTAV